MQEFRNFYSNNLAHVGSHLEAHNATFADQHVVRQAVLDYQEEHFGADSEEYENAADAFDRYVAGKSGRVKDLPGNVQQVIRNVNAAINESESHDAFQQALDAIQENVQEKAANEGWSEKERRMALSHVVVMQETMGFVKTNQALYVKNGYVKNGFLDTWQCIAGTISGAVTGGYVGYKVGGIWGAIAGAAVGGLYGAAGNC